MLRNSEEENDEIWRILENRQFISFSFPTEENNEGDTVWDLLYGEWILVSFTRDASLAYTDSLQ